MIVGSFRAQIKSPSVYNVGIDFMLLEGFEILGRTDLLPMSTR